MPSFAGLKIMLNTKTLPRSVVLMMVRCILLCVAGLFGLHFRQKFGYYDDDDMMLLFLRCFPCAALMVTTLVSYLSHSQVWALQEGSLLHVGGRSNRATVTFKFELEDILNKIPERLPPGNADAPRLDSGYVDSQNGTSLPQDGEIALRDGGQAALNGKAALQNGKGIAAEEPVSVNEERHGP
jgi:hypothetical protein